MGPKIVGNFMGCFFLVADFVFDFDLLTGFALDFVVGDISHSPF